MRYQTRPRADAAEPVEVVADRITRGLAYDALRLAVTGIAVLATSGSLQAATPGFTDQTEAAGLSFVHGPNKDYNTGGEMHGGGTVGDFNADGWPDLFATGGGETPDVLYINNGDGTFTDRAAEWGLSDSYRGNGAAVGDYDKDGWQDLYVTSHGDMDGALRPGQHRLYRNTGTGAFEEVAVAAGVNETADRHDGFGATFGDYDLDGDLDLFVAGWHFNPGATLPRSRLFRNDGDGTFTDVTRTANVGHNNAAPTGAFGAIFVDMNHDRYPELLVAADGGHSFYYENNRDGTFSTVDIFVPDTVHHAMGATVADFDRNGELDWFVTAAWPSMLNLGPPGNRLYMNAGNHVYAAMPDSAGVNDGGFGWGTAAIDYDHDGWVDIVMTNGWPYVDPEHGHVWTDEPSYLFHNNRDQTFSEVAQDYGLVHTGQGRSLVHLDYDKDGDMDIVIFSYEEPMRLFRNDLTGSDTGWLEVVLDTSAHPGLAPNGLGARVRVRAAGEEQFQNVTGGSNYLGRSELVAHFGLGSATVVNRVLVTWPDGFRTTLDGIAANQVLVIEAEPPMSHAPFVRGQPAELTVQGLAAGERAFFFSSFAGAGEGPCLAYFGGLCVDLEAAAYRGNAVADADGTAVLTVTVPPSPALQAIHVQSLVRRGDAGGESLITNVASGTVTDP